MDTEVTASQTTAASDEISLVDLLRVLLKRKNTLLFVFALFVLGGVVAALVLPKQYQYTTTIEIGTTVVKDDIRLIDDPNTLLAKIQESYIPLALLHYRETYPDDKKVYELKARIPKNSEIIVLEAKGSKETAEIYKRVQNDVVDQIITDHSRLILIIHKEYQLEGEKIQNEVASLEDKSKLLQAKSKRLGENEKLLTRQIDRVRQLVNDGIINREKASREVKDETHAMTLLMIDNEIQQNRQRLDELEERLTVELINERDVVENELADTLRKITEKKSELTKVKLQRDNLRETRSIVPPMQSLEPVGASKKLIVLLAVLLGIFVALFAAFIHELIVKTKDELSQ
jgi:LPS O-antigen subunit length determinant protein (WzzB/FepE family)